MSRRLLAVALLAALLLACPPASAVEDPIPSEVSADASAPLDLGHEKVDEVSVDGVSYDVVRYDSVFPWVSGYEFFDGHRRVVDGGEAEAVARQLAWKRGVKDLEPDDVEEMREVARRTRSVERLVEPVHSTVDATLSHVDLLKEREIPLSDRSYWSLAVDIHPELEAIESALRSVEPRLDGWRRSAEGVGDRLDEVADVYAAAEAGEEFDAPSGLESYRNATSRMREFEDRSAALESDLEVVADVSGSAADELEAAGTLGDWASAPFRSTEIRASEAEESVESLRLSVESSRRSLGRLVDSVDRERRRLKTGWQRRQHATARALLSVLGFLATVAAAAVGYRYRRRLPVLESRFGEGGGG